MGTLLFPVLLEERLLQCWGWVEWKVSTKWILGITSGWGTSRTSRQGFYGISLKVEVHIKHLRKVGWSQQWLEYELALDKGHGAGR